jgi:hypothetical protein
LSEENEVSRFFWIQILSLSIGSPTALSFASDLTKLAPEPLVVHLQNGAGSEKVIFAKGSGISVSKVSATQASGRVGSIPESDIKATIEKEVDPNLLTIILEVKTQQVVERGVPYKGVLLLFTQVGKPPEQAAFSVEDDTAVGIESLQTSVDVAVGVWQPPRYQILIRNNGRISCDTIAISSSNLTDATTGKRIVVANSNPDWGKNPIQPEGERVVSFDLPQPNEAGTFVGQLYITANQQKTVAVPFTVRSRGPWGTTIIPFALFCLVLGIGFWVSGVLDNWFSGGGLARAQAYLSLRNSQAALVQRYAVLQDWKSHLPPPPPTIGLPKTEVWLQLTIQSLGDELRSVDSLSQDQLTNDVQQYALAVGTISLFWSVVQVAMNRWGNQPDQLQLATAAIDGVPRPASAPDLNQYRSQLLAALPVSLGKDPSVEAQVQSVSRLWTPEGVQRKIKIMALLYQVVIWATVFFTAYQAYFAHNLAFGTLSDYIVLFVWSLGLTQTGSQIVSRVHK